MSLIVKRTAVAGGSDPQVIGPDQMAATVGAALLAAGWTQVYHYGSSFTLWNVSTSYGIGDIIHNLGLRFQCTIAGISANSGSGPNGGMDSLVTDGTVQWRVLSESNITEDKVYFSTGESGQDAIWFHMRPVFLHNAVNTYTYQYFANGFGYNRLGYLFNSSLGYSNTGILTSPVNQDYVLVVDKDNGALAIKRTSDGVRCNHYFGNLKRLPGTLPTMISAADATFGTNVVINVSPSNPIALGYSVGDVVFVLTQQIPEAPYSISSETIPYFASEITALTTSSITLARIPIDLTGAVRAGARIGENPSPYVMTTENDVPPNGQVIGILNHKDTAMYNIREASQLANYNGFNGRIIAYDVGQQGLLENDPNNRTGRVGMYEYFVWTNIPTNPQSGIVGIIDKMYEYSVNSHPDWDTARTVKEATPRDFTVFVTNGTRRMAIGPLVGGSASGTVRKAEILPISTTLWSDDFKLTSVQTGFDVNAQINAYAGTPRNVADVYTEDDQFDDGLVSDMRAYSETQPPVGADMYSGDVPAFPRVRMSALFRSTTLITASLADVPVSVNTNTSGWSITGPSAITIVSLNWVGGTSEIDFVVSGSFVDGGVYTLTLHDPIGISTKLAYSDLDAEFVAIIATGSSGSAFNTGYN
jgi:hypothetical protein